VDIRLGLIFRSVRVQRRWTQQVLGQRAGVSRQLVSKIERGVIDSVSVRSLRAVGAALGIRVEVVARGAAGEVDRTLNAGHAAMHEAVARLFRVLPGWSPAPEVSFSIYGERGVIDILAWHAASRTLLVIELKTAIVDINDLMGSMDRRRRLAAQIGRERGWVPLVVATWVLIADTPTNRRRLAEHATALRSAFPEDGRAMRRWLRRPTGAIRALSFLSIATGRGARRDFRPIRQVRGPKPTRSERGK
jgi:transcriptional regulator with XRE-family HTH domain